jgi:hypothetical protein
MVNNIRNIVKKRKRQTENKQARRAGIKVTEESEGDQDPNVDLEGFRDATRQLLLESNYLRRPMVTTNGPLKAQTTTHVFN